MTVPSWLFLLSATDGCGTSWQIQVDGSVAILVNGQVVTPNVSSVTVAGDGLSASLVCPGCGRTIEVAPMAAFVF